MAQVEPTYKYFLEERMVTHSGKEIWTVPYAVLNQNIDYFTSSQAARDFYNTMTKLSGDVFRIREEIIIVRENIVCTIST